MENKYFTPDIEDVYIGYEHETYSIGLQMINGRFLPDNERDDELKWRPRIIKCGSDILSLEAHSYQNEDELYKSFKTLWKNYIRVPYLTKEQIEAEGWTEFITEYRGDIKLENMNYVFFNEKSNYMLGWFFNRNQIGLLVKDPAKALDINGNIINYNDAPRYTGECKDINTFRKIIKLLGI